MPKSNSIFLSKKQEFNVFILQAVADSELRREEQELGV